MKTTITRVKMTHEDRVTISIRNMNWRTKSRLRNRLFEMKPGASYVDAIGSFCITRGKTYASGTTWYTFTMAHMRTGVVTSGKFRMDKDDLHVCPEDLQIVGTLNPTAEPFQQGFLASITKFANNETKERVAQ